MGIYDVNLKKTGVGYQFDHNVYIGIQTNDNRVVTFKDLDDAVATQITAAGGGEDIELFITKSGAGAHKEFGDRISFHRNNREYVYDIAPQYVTSPGQISTQDWSSSKVCLLKPVPTSETDPTPIGYQIYTSDYAPASLLTLNIGNSPYTYDGSTPVTINFDTIPTINADSIAITTEVTESSPHTEIPTAQAVYKALALAPGIATVTPSSVTAAAAVITSIAYDSANHSLNYDYITQTFNNNVTLNWGQAAQYASIGDTTYSITLPAINTIPTINADSVAITTVVDNDSTDTEIPTALAVYGALALAPGIAHVESTSVDAASAMVTSITYTGGSSRTLSYTTITHTLDDAVLQWGQPISYATVGTHTYNITLPAVNTIPTINADSVDIVTEIPNSDDSTKIPTAGAVHKFASAAGSLRITEAVSGYLVGVESQPTSTTQTLAPVGSSSIKWATTASLADAASQWINANITGQLNHTLQITVAETTKTFSGSADVEWEFSNEFKINNSQQIALNAELHDNTDLDWGTAVSYGSVAGQTKTLTLPNVNTIPTINADSVSITTQISSSHSSAIPTEGAVYEFAAAAGSVKATASASGYILGTSTGVTVTSATIAYTPVGTNDLRWADSTTGLPTASKWINANITGKLNKTFTVFGQVYDGSESKTITASTGIAVSAAGTVSLDATFTHPTLVWGQPVTYATVANTDYTITLPTVNTIPTINADSVAITPSINSVTPSGAIPTDAAVLDALAWAPGISSVVSTGTAGMMTSLAYDSANHILSYTQAAAAISGQTVTLGDASVTVPSLGVSHNQAAYGDHTHSTFTVFGQAYDGSSSKTVSAGDGITVSDGEVSLNAIFHDPTLEWGASKSYAVVAGNTHYITLPAVNTIPTVNANSVSIATSISSSSSSAIPTEGAVSAAIAGAVPHIAAGNNITITTSEPTKTISLDLINQWINYKSTSGTHMATDAVGRVHLYNNFEYQILSGDSDPVIMVQPQAIYINPNASTTNSVSLTINTYGISAATHVWVPSVNSSSSDYAAANKGYVDNIGMTYDAATNVVTFTNAAGASISFTTASDWSDITGKPTFFTVNLDWNSPVKFVELGSTTYSISLPNVSTIPTINASSIAITGTISGTTDIPTDQAVNNALANYVTKSAFSYDASTGVLTLTI